MRIRGFTIVELLVVIVVIGILAAITIVSYTGISSRATSASLQSDLSNAKKQLALYQVEHSAYPASPLTITGNTYCPSDDTKYCFKASSGNTLTYTPASGSSPQAFSLVSKNNTTYYNLTNNTQPTAVTPMAAASVSATGAYTLSSDGPYRIYTFTGNGTITTSTPGTAEVLVVGGGGGGGVGGGGAGGFIIGTQTISGTITVTIGAGGAGGVPNTSAGSAGIDSTFGITIAKGGGYGGWWNSDSGHLGGSGGGGGHWSGGTTTGGAATPIGQGNSGSGNAGYATPPYPAGGGGGAGSAGSIPSNANTGGIGGSGLSSLITGILQTYAVGGNGNTLIGSTTAVSGAANTGNGGSGAHDTATGGSGGSGIVIIRYLTP